MMLAFRCFFVYAPVFEVGRDEKIPQLMAYGQKRIAYLTGYIRAREDFRPRTGDPSPTDLRNYKEHGISLERRLRNALSTADRIAFEGVMSHARQCDLDIGLPTKDIPVW